MSLSINDLRVVTPRPKLPAQWRGTIAGDTRPASLADLIQVLLSEGAYEWTVDEDDVLGDPGTYLVYRLKDGDT